MSKIHPKLIVVVVSLLFLSIGFTMSSQNQQSKKLESNEHEAQMQELLRRYMEASNNHDIDPDGNLIFSRYAPI